MCLFQSTHPVWGATCTGAGPHRPQSHFNPRTPCGVRRPPWSCAGAGWWNFNPRTPCGVRHWDKTEDHLDDEFQSTHPVWGATRGHRSCGGCPRFQSTHPVWGATTPSNSSQLPKNFNPRTPCGVRPVIPHLNKLHFFISIHAPRVGCDRPISGWDSVSVHFNPRTPCGVRRWASSEPVTLFPNFNPRTPCGVRRPAT